MMILGESGEQVAREEQGLDLWKSWTQEVQDVPLEPYRRVSTSAPSLAARWEQLAALARTPGLSGIVIDDLQPFGYEGAHVDYMHGKQERPLGELTDFGYSVNERLRFLRAHSVDPIDMMCERLFVRTDLRQPFFRTTPPSGGTSLVRCLMRSCVPRRCSGIPTGQPPTRRPMRP